MSIPTVHLTINGAMPIDIIYIYTVYFDC